MGFSFDYRDGNYMMYTVARYSPRPNWGDTEKRKKMIRRVKDENKHFLLEELAPGKLYSYHGVLTFKVC